MMGSAIVTSAKHMTLSLPCASLPQEMHSVASVAPPSPPKTVLSVVICIEALCGVGSTLPWRVRTLFSRIFREALGTPPPRKTTHVPRLDDIGLSLMSVAVPEALKKATTRAPSALGEGL